MAGHAHEVAEELCEPLKQAPERDDAVVCAGIHPRCLRRAEEGEERVGESEENRGERQFEHDDEDERVAERAVYAFPLRFVSVPK